MWFLSERFYWCICWQGELNCTVYDYAVIGWLFYFSDRPCFNTFSAFTEKENPSPSRHDVDGSPVHFKKQMNLYHMKLNRILELVLEYSYVIMAVIWEKWKTDAQPKNLQNKEVEMGRSGHMWPSGAEDLWGVPLAPGDGIYSFELRWGKIKTYRCTKCFPLHPACDSHKRACRRQN